MSETEAPVAVASGSPKKKAAASKKPRAKPAHPKTSDMVDAAIKNLKERGGSSLQAIKKYISANYKVDAEKLSPFIKKYLKTSVGNGKLVQTKGKGASGSFKLASKEKAEKGEKKVKAAPAAKKAKSPTKPKKAAVKTAAKPRAAAAPKKAAPAKKAKSPSKAKKATKAPAAKKPKTPKPKKAAAKPKSAKKAAPKKK